MATVVIFCPRGSDADPFIVNTSVIAFDTTSPKDVVRQFVEYGIINKDEDIKNFLMYCLLDTGSSFTDIKNVINEYYRNMLDNINTPQAVFESDDGGFITPYQFDIDYGESQYDEFFMMFKDQFIDLVDQLYFSNTRYFKNYIVMKPLKYGTLDVIKEPV
jgi:hypothetical protein